MFTYREVSIYEAEINQELLEEDTRDIQLEFDLENNMNTFCDADAKTVAEALMDNDVVKKTDREENLIEIEELVKQNLVDGKVGIELLQIYGSKEKYLSAVEDSTLHPEVNIVLQEELKDIYFAFRDFVGELDQTRELVKRLESNIRKMYRTSNARYILLKIAEDYLSKGRIAQVLDDVYGKGVTDTIGKAINLALDMDCGDCCYQNFQYYSRIYL